MIDIKTGNWKSVY